MRWFLLTVPFAIAILAEAASADAVTQGAALYTEICLKCHGPTATESQVGDIRGLSLGTVTSAVRSGPGMMPTFSLTADEIAAIVAYLAQI